LAKRAEIDAQNEGLAESGKTVEWMSAWDVREVVVSRARLEDARVKARSTPDPKPYTLNPKP
jgi:hypothetical protein